MEIRKFIIELHPNGRMTWCEYEDPEYTYKRGRVDGMEKMLNIVSRARIMASHMIGSKEYKQGANAAITYILHELEK